MSTVNVTFRETRYGFTTGALPAISVDCDRCGEAADFHHFDVDDDHGYLGTVCSVCRADQDATVFVLRPDLVPAEAGNVSVAMLACLTLALVPVGLLAVFLSSLAGAVAGTF